MRERANLATRNSLLERVVALKEEQQHTLKHSSQDEVTPGAQAAGITLQASWLCDGLRQSAAASVHVSSRAEPPQ